ncbi:DUF559 domain-containing protein [Methyloferula stellata]|uniref:DUF559 domain-containing protein n=1 Tax=Methyloferula stellata TaxID=876270 RepID=UPI00244E2EE1|nr:DUF559 domain-containing protein [Methyloferula stellata]
MTDPIPRNVMMRLARKQRKDSVNAEAIIWRALRDRRCNNFKFRRQVPIGSYIADFICFEKRLLIEIDGPSQHRRIKAYAMRRGIIGFNKMAFESCASPMIW